MPMFTNGSVHWALTPRGLFAWTGTSVDPPGPPAAVGSLWEDLLGKDGSAPFECDPWQWPGNALPVYRCFFRDGLVLILSADPPQNSFHLPDILAAWSPDGTLAVTSLGLDLLGPPPAQPIPEPTPVAAVPVT